MRLNNQEKSVLLKGLRDSKWLLGEYKLYLFGSRLDDNKKGGDIDLLLVVESNNFEKIASNKHRILVDLKKNLEDQRVDLVICTHELLQSQDFLRDIWPTAVLLG